LKFRRQHAIGDYIADFICLEISLIIEVDGEYHNSEEQQEKDTIRTKYLNEQGFYVLRFTNNEVINQTEWVLKSIIDSPPALSCREGAAHLLSEDDNLLLFPPFSELFPALPLSVGEGGRGGRLEWRGLLNQS